MESKERIKDRIIRSAAKLWNINETEIESNFDPIVKLLLDACSYELEKINVEMEASNSRMIERLIEVILPDAIIGIRPASAIVHALPSDNEYETSRLQLKFEKRINQNNNETKPIYFNPIGKFKLNNAELKYIVSENKIFQLRNYWQKELALSFSQSGSQKEKVLFLGIEINEGIKKLKGLNLFFDYKNELNKELFYSSLKHVKCSIDGRAVNISTGMLEEPGFVNLNIEMVSASIFQQDHKTCNHIYQLYKNNFLNLPDPIELGDAKKMPDVLSENLDAESLNKLSPDLLWIKLIFPENLPEKILENVFCNINCFPVINKKNNELTFKTQKYINIIPLETGDFYFDINSIISANAYKYHKRNMVSSTELLPGDAVVRSTGIGRFDSREARDVINYLLQIIRDETSTFAEIGGEMIANKMRELNQVISRIEDQMTKFEKKGPTNYLMLKPQKENETIYIEFWTTNGKMANEIKPGSRLIQDKGSMLKSDSIYLLTSSVGGKNAMNLEDKINLFRKYLLVKERIVSNEDIRILCYQIFENRIKSVEIKKGVNIGSDNKTGFNRTIDITISLNKNVTIESNERDYLKNELAIQLENNSSSVYPYRIILA